MAVLIGRLRCRKAQRQQPANSRSRVCQLIFHTTSGRVVTRRTRLRPRQRTRSSMPFAFKMSGRPLWHEQVRRRRRTHVARPRHEALEQALKQRRQDKSLKRGLQARGAYDIDPVDPGAMRNHIAGIGMTENEPRITFVRHSVVDVDGKTKMPENACRTAKLCQILAGPISATATRTAQINHAPTHPTPSHVGA